MEYLNNIWIWIVTNPYLVTLAQNEVAMTVIGIIGVAALLFSFKLTVLIGVAFGLLTYIRFYS